MQLHHGDCLRVTFRGMLDWDEAIDLVETIDTGIDAYFYDTVEIVIRSGGGMVAALEHYLRAADRCARTGRRW